MSGNNAGIRIFGIDPGSRTTGYGVVDQINGRTFFVACGTVRGRAKSLADRLWEIHCGISEAIAEHTPDLAAIEKVFVSVNPASALKLGHARGVLILAAREKGMAVAEYSPSQIKQAVAGYGRAEKSQVQEMVRVILGLNKKPSSDAADALAVAMCHANHYLVSGLSSSEARR